MTEESKKTNEKNMKKEQLQEDKPVEAPPAENTIKEEKEKNAKKVERPKRTEAIVNAYNIPISTKHCMAISKFIKGKTIAQARKDLEDVLKFKKAVPMKGEIPHRKGKIMSGRYPQKSVKNFLVLLKSLEGNSQDINTPVIVEAIANIGERPYGRFGRVRKKRTHIYLKAIEKKLKEDKKKAKGAKKK